MITNNHMITISAYIFYKNLNKLFFLRTHHEPWSKLLLGQPPQTQFFFSRLPIALSTTDIVILLKSGQINFSNFRQTFWSSLRSILSILPLPVTTSTAFSVGRSHVSAVSAVEPAVVAVVSAATVVESAVVSAESEVESAVVSGNWVDGDSAVTFGCSWSDDVPKNHRRPRSVATSRRSRSFDRTPWLLGLFA